MKSTMLAIIVTMVISAIYSVQNIGDVTISFLIFKWSFPQGVWDIVLFCSGAVMMWFFSILANRETKNKHRREIKELNEKLESIERDRNELISSITAAKARQEQSNVACCATQPVSQTPTEAGSAEEKE